MGDPLSYWNFWHSLKRCRLRLKLRAAVAGMEDVVQEMETTASELSMLAKEIAAAAEAAAPKDSDAATGHSSSPRSGYKAYKSHCDKHGCIRSTEAAQLVEDAVSAVRLLIQGTHLAVMKAHQAIEMSITSAFFTGVASWEVLERQEEPMAEAWLSPGVDLHNAVSLGLDATQQTLRAPVAPSLHYLNQATKTRRSLRANVLALDRHMKESRSRLELLYSIAGSADGWLQYPCMPASAASCSRLHPKSMAELLLEETRGVFKCLGTAQEGIKSAGSLCHDVAAHIKFVHTSDSFSKTSDTAWAEHGFEKKFQNRFQKKDKMLRRLEQGIRCTTKPVKKLEDTLHFYNNEVYFYKALQFGL